MSKAIRLEQRMRAAKVGRPRAARGIKLQVRMFPYEREAWQRAADAMSVDLGTWIRSVCNAESVKKNE